MWLWFIISKYGQRAPQSLSPPSWSHFKLLKKVRNALSQNPYHLILIDTIWSIWPGYGPLYVFRTFDYCKKQLFPYHYTRPILIWRSNKPIWIFWLKILLHKNILLMICIPKWAFEGFYIVQAIRHIPISILFGPVVARQAILNYGSLMCIPIYSMCHPPIRLFLPLGSTENGCVDFCGSDEIYDLYFESLPIQRLK